MGAGGEQGVVKMDGVIQRLRKQDGKNNVNQGKQETETESAQHDGCFSAVVLVDEKTHGEPHFFGSVKAAGGHPPAALQVTLKIAKLQVRR
jgi:hypothetical protein